MQEILVSMLNNNPVLAPLIFILLRPLSSIIPPIPGAIFDIAGLLAFGWVWGFIYGEAGIMLGAMIAFWLARYFREPVVRKITSLEKIETWEATLSEKKKFWGMVALRLCTNSLFDYISYAAGLTRMSSWKFFLSSLIGSIPGLFLFYYFGGLLYQNSIYYAVIFLASILVLGGVIAKKGQLLELVMGKSSSEVKNPTDT